MSKMKLPDGWKYIKLSELFDEESEKNHSDAEVLTIVQGVGTVPRKDSGRDIIYDKNSLSNYKYVRKDDFIIHLRSFEGGLEIANQEGIVSPAYIILRTKIQAEPGYLYTLFHSNRFINQTMAPAVEGVRDGRTVKYEVLKNQSIPFPPLAEQQKIAEILCKQDKMISLKQKLLEQKLQQKKWLMQKLLEVPHSNANCEEKFPLGGVMIDKNGWKKDRLGRVSSISTGYKPKKVLKSGNYLFINAGCEYSGFTDDFNALADSITTPSRGQGGIGFVAYQYQDFWCGPLCYQIRDNTEQNNNKYMYYYLNYTNKNIKDLVQVGTIPAVNLTDLEKIYIHLPTLPEQKIIAKVLSAADKEIALLKSSIEQEKQKKKSLAQLLLTGTVRVKI